MRQYTARPRESTPRPLDDLSAGAIALLFHLRRHGWPRWFVAGSPSARHASELAAAGYIVLRRDAMPGWPVPILRATWPWEAEGVRR